MRPLLGVLIPEPVNKLQNKQTDSETGDGQHSKGQANN